MIGNTFRVSALGNTNYLCRHGQLLLLHHLEVAYHIDSRLRSDQSKLVEFLILEEFVFDLDDAFLSLSLAGEVDTYGDLVLDAGLR